MAGLFGTLHSASSGMSVSQASLQTTSHNINNVNTPGYSRQKVNQSAKSAYSYPGYNSSMGPGQLGTGVQATSITRIRNTFYDYQYRSEAPNYGETATKYEYYTNMENIFNEPSDSSISSSINNFFSSWHSLSQAPEDVGRKTIVTQNANYLANTINKVYSSLENLDKSADEQLSIELSEINNSLKQLNELNQNIKIIENTGKNPNDLYDERDRILDELSSKLNLEDADVKGIIGPGADGKFNEIANINELKTMVTDSSTTPPKIKDSSGEVGGIFKMKEEIKYYTEQVKELASGIVDAVNSVYNTAGEDLFKMNGSSIEVNPDILSDPSKLKVDSSLAIKLHNVKDDPRVNTFYNNLIQKLGVDTKEVIRNESNQSKILLNIDNARKSISGVSMDEEMISLVQFQHAYNASAKVVSTIDSLLDVVINGLIR